MSRAHRDRTQEHPTRRSLHRHSTTAALAASLCLPLAGLLLAASAVAGDDTEMFRANVAPNIMIIADNSGSMQNVVWHPDYGANQGQTQCQAFRNALGTASSSIAYNPSGEANRLETKDYIDIRFRESWGSVTHESWEPPIYLADGTQLWWDKDEDGVKDAGEDYVYHRTCNPESSFDISSHCSDHNVVYDRWGVPMTNALGKPLYYYNEDDTASSERLRVFSRVTPANLASQAGLNHLDLGFHSDVCGISTTGVSLPTGDITKLTGGGESIWLNPAYLDFLFSSVGSNARQAVLAPTTANGGLRAYSACLGKPAGSSYEIHRRTRIQALQLILETVVCEVNQDNVVRFGLSQYRTVGSSWDPNGGYAVLPINNFKQADGSLNTYTLHGVTASHGEHLGRVIGEIGPDTSTPLGETLFQVYTYFMSREKTKLPYGRNSSGTQNSYQFPVYSYDSQQPCKPAYTTCAANQVGGYALTLKANGDAHDDTPPSPAQYSCQKNFVLLITDGGSWGDLFNATDPTSVTRGFGDFRNLIGDHYDDGEVECCYDDDFTGTYVTADVTAAASAWALHSRYLDDIAYFMNRWDFLPDETSFPGDQTLDVYTVGFSLQGSGVPADVLSRTAANANGLYFESSDTDQLADDIVTAVNDMINKAQAFTSATVPASRTTDSDSFYSSYFEPRDDSPFWDGHLKSFKFTAAGDILTSTDNCAVGTDANATAPCDNSGLLRTSAQAVWDASASMPAPDSRKLLYPALSASAFAQPADWDSVTKDDLALEASDLDIAPYDAAKQSADAAANLTTLAGLIRDNIKGCQFGTSCTPRALENGTTSTLGDIFHSDPAVVGPPNSAINEASYRAFAEQYRYRDRVLYAGSNDGFLHAFHAGAWDAGATPAAYTRGTGVELFGYMPGRIVRSIKQLPIANPSDRGYYGVDGSPVVSDVWFYRNLGSGAALAAANALLSHPAPTDSAAIEDDKQRWRTVAIGGLRQGGVGYYALDITDPADTSYPRYLWEFPCAPGSGSCEAAADHMGQSWSEPVITRVRVKVNGSSDPRGHERWVAIFGGGYAPQGDPNSTQYDAGYETHGRGIFILDITTGQILAYKYFHSSEYSISGTQIGFTDMKYAVASAPAVFDLDFDGFADVIYIGDLGGNIWKWVVKEVGDDPINNASSDNNLAQPNWPFGLFFRARTSSTSFDDGTDTWSAGIHFNSFFNPPTGVLRGSTLVLALGSSERANPKAWDSDGLDTNNNRFYVLKDGDPLERGSDTIQAEDLVVGATGRALKESLDLSNITTTTTDCSQLNQNFNGYYVVARDAEKFVTRSVIFLGQVLTGSYIPPNPYTGDLCDKPGSAYLYIFGVDCGGGLFTPAAGNTSNDTPDKQRRTDVGSGIPTRPRISVGNINEAGGGGANRAIVVTSDGGVVMQDTGNTNSSGVNVRTWRER
jgi:hypothetical protein